IILKDVGHPTSFNYEVNLVDYDYELNENGSIDFFKKGKDKDPLFKLFSILTPYMTDAQGETSQAVSYSIAGGNIILTADEEWLSTASYPVVIDPTVEITVLNIHSH